MAPQRPSEDELQRRAIEHEQTAPFAEDRRERIPHRRRDVGLLHLIAGCLKCETVVYGPTRQAGLETLPANDLDGAR